VIDGEHGLVAVEVVGVELETAAGDLEAAVEDGAELVELNAAVEAGAEGLDDFGFEKRLGAAEKDIAGDESGDGKDREDGADPKESDNEAVMAAAGGRSSSFDRMRGQASSLYWFFELTGAFVLRHMLGLWGCTQRVAEELFSLPLSTGRARRETGGRRQGIDDMKRKGAGIREHDSSKQ
jgi:hypothetical protein